MKFLFHSPSWIEYWPHRPSYGSALRFPHTRDKRVLWDCLWTLWGHLTWAQNHKFAVLLIPLLDQNPLSFAYSSLVAYQRWFCFQEGRLISASISLKMNRGTAL